MSENCPKSLSIYYIFTFFFFTVSEFMQNVPYPMHTEQKYIRNMFPFTFVNNI